MFDEYTFCIMKKKDEESVFYILRINESKTLKEINFVIKLYAMWLVNRLRTIILTLKVHNPLRYIQFSFIYITFPFSSLFITFIHQPSYNPLNRFSCYFQQQIQYWKWPSEGLFYYNWIVWGRVLEVVSTRFLTV